MMPTKQNEERRSEPTSPDRKVIGGLIGRNVLGAIGRPTNLLRVQVQWLWLGYYRVNVFVGADAASAAVAHSFFLEASDAGVIITSTPALARQY